MAVIAIQILGIISTGSRAGMLTTMLICGLLFIRNIKRPLTVILIAGIVFFTADLVREKFAERSITTESLGGTRINSSLESRFEAASGAIMLWLYNPLFGVGPNNYAAARAEELGLRGSDAGLSAHNTTLQILAETGTIGMLIFLTLLLKGFKAIKRTAEVGDAFYKELAQSIKVFMLAFCVGTLFVNTFIYEIYWVWLTIPFLMRGACLAENEAKQPLVAG
jgi:O-antigen ligase